jgi:ribosomal protein S18 acetylase RimI-like enzyme
VGVAQKIEVYDSVAGSRLAPGFDKLDWNAECDVVMIASRTPDREADGSIAQEVPAEELVPIWAEAARGDRHVEDDEVVRQLAEGKRVLMSAIDTQFFAARVDGQIGGYCELYSGAGVGQIENVLTLERYRNRGLARAMVLRALAASEAAGNNLTFLLANRDDWPKELYCKLGFDEIGQIYDFVLPPAK